MSLEIVILAAGNGQRMKSDLPKVLHPIGGKSLLVRVIETAVKLNPLKIHVICGVHTEVIRTHANQCLSDVSKNLVHWIYQEKPLGTGHAVQCALPFLDLKSQVLVLFGDVPLISAKTLCELQEKTADYSLGLLSVKMLNPFGFGRVIRDERGNIQAIVEEKDANAEQKAIHEIFSGILLSKTEALLRWLPELKSNNAQGEYYLTDIIQMCVLENQPVMNTQTSDFFEVQGVNDRVQLMGLERVYQENLAKNWLLEGVNIIDPKRFDVRGDWKCGQNTTIDVNVVFEGNNSIGENCYIAPNCVIKNSELANNVIVYANSILDGVCVKEQCEIGPFARLRPETVLENNTKVGNFVEMKKTHMGAYSKVNHLSYIGDTIMGEKVNIGAGTITCNYDGVNKHQTIIDDGAFIGSDTQLVAPVRVGKNATIGAGSTIRRDAPADQLTLSGLRQTSVPNWKRPVTKKKVDTT